MPERFGIVPWKHHVCIVSKSQTIYQLQEVVERTIAEIENM